MPLRKCLWCHDGAVKRERGGYRCNDCGEFLPLPRNVSERFDREQRGG